MSLPDNPYEGSLGVVRGCVWAGPWTFIAPNLPTSDVGALRESPTQTLKMGTVFVHGRTRVGHPTVPAYIQNKFGQSR